MTENAENAENAENNHEERGLNLKTLTEIIKEIDNDQNFIYPEAVSTAISEITLAVHNSYSQPDDNPQNLIRLILQVLQRRPVPQLSMTISRSELAKKPLIMQLLILMQHSINEYQHDYLQKRLIWLAIAMHTSVILMQHSTKQHTKNILMQFKQAQFSRSSRRTWVWRELPDLPQMTMSVESILTIFTVLLEQQKSAYELLNDQQATHAEEKKVAKDKLSQIEKITTAYQHAHVPQKPKPKRKKLPKNIKVKAINLADNTSRLPLDSTATSHNWNTTPSNDAWGNESFLKTV